MKTKIRAATSTVLSAISAIVEAPDPAAIEGNWLLEDGTMAIEIAPADRGLRGTLVCLHNDADAGGVALTELSLEPTGKGVYKGGEFRDPGTGRRYFRCELRVQDDGKLRLHALAGGKDGQKANARVSKTFRFTRVG